MMRTTLDHNADELREALEHIRLGLGEMLRPLGRFAGVRIGERVVNAYMRAARGEGPRRPGDGGPLRMVEGRIARAVNLGRDARFGGRSAGFQRIRVTKNKMTLRKGINTKLLPQASAHEHGATIRAVNAPFLKFKTPTGWVQVKEVTIPARPFLQPAFEDVLPEIREEGTRLLLEHIGGRLAA